MGLIDGQLIAIDGTKIRAQNGKHNCITQSGLEKKIEYADAQINAYFMAMEKEELKNEGLEQKSLTDTDSRRMKNNGSLDICYNVQSVVDSKNHFVIDISTTNDINDQNQLYVMAKDATELLAVESPTVIADTGYYNGTEIKNCVDDGMNVYRCPAGNQLSFFENTSKSGIKYKRYKCTDCKSCKYKEKCTTSSSGRTIQRWEQEDILETIYFKTWNNNDVYKQRRCIVEHPFGTVKRTLGYSYFLRRQKENVMFFLDTIF